MAASVVFATSPPVLAQSAIPEVPAASGTLLQIEATGTARAAPDVMTVTAGIVTTGSTAIEALNRNDELAGRMIGAVKASGIPIGTLQTASLSVNPRFAGNRNRDESEEQAPRITGYIARNSLEIELVQVAQASELIGLLFEAGANEIRGPVFSLRNPTPVQRQAERAAVAAALHEAQNYADALGMKVSRVVRVSDRSFRSDERQMIVVTGSRIGVTPIEPGEITSEVTVHAEFLLQPK
ncbi:SIMPL domain-containing protein [Altericroceibacterium xinjiangense]|uniref:SIMPL domain-containing protein n=1 Tax=Altericroceibacterium xinjiangense TaxID=762261 RepID=UPI0013DF66EF|nr:SIMPL domain-containing protein [Altericroceibacterium xinjiangense]